MVFNDGVSDPPGDIIDPVVDLVFLGKFVPPSLLVPNQKPAGFSGS